jgi:ABC-type multidrug transport system ATPase subunit
VIEVTNLTKSFADKVVFQNYSTCFSSKRLCIEAENGLGKTTLFTIIAGLDPHYSGDILLDGQKWNKLQTKVAIASDKIPFPAFLTAKQVLSLTQASWQCDWPDALCKNLHFNAFLDTKVSELSSGNQKKLQLINAIMRHCDYLILDEPSAALDADSMKALLAWIEQYEGQLLISCHEPQPFLELGFSTQPLFSELV